MIIIMMITWVTLFVLGYWKGWDNGYKEGLVDGELIGQLIEIQKVQAALDYKKRKN